MGQDEGRGPDRVDQDLVGRGQAVQDQADREVVGQDPVDDRVDSQISDSLDVARAVPPVNHAQDARATTTKAGVKAQAALACLLHIK